MSDNIGIRYDNMVKFPKDDELGLFENYDEILEETRRRIKNHNGTYILDIGCGTGNLCGKLDSTYNIVGIDKNHEMLERAKEKYKHIKFRVGNFLESPFKKSYADIVVSTFAFHGLTPEEKKTAIKNMLKYIKPNGKIIIVDYMFSSSEEKEKYKQYFISQNKEDLWNFISSKNYSIIEYLKEYTNNLNCKISVDHIINFTWIVEISRGN